MLNPCPAGHCATGHAFTEEQALSPADAAANHVTAPEKCFLMVDDESRVVEGCLQPGTEEIRLVNKISPIKVFHSEEATLIGEVIWPVNCLYEPLCWTYNIREQTLNRHVFSNSSAVAKPVRQSHGFTAVGQNLVLYGGFGKTNWKRLENMVVYDTVSGAMTTQPLSHAEITTPLCTVAVSDTEFVTVGFPSPQTARELPPDCVLSLEKHKLGSTEVTALPCAKGNVASGNRLECTADARFIYAKEVESSTVWKFDLQSQEWIPSGILLVTKEHAYDQVVANHLGMGVLDGNVYTFHSYLAQGTKHFFIIRVDEEGEPHSYPTTYSGVGFSTIKALIKKP